jgi:hypothetical protein
MEKLFVIISLRHTSKEEGLCFWRSDNAGYTVFPWAAGIYKEQEVLNDPVYYNDGDNVAVELLDKEAWRKIGLKVDFDQEALIKLARARNQRK